MKSIYSPQSVEKDCLAIWAKPNYTILKDNATPYCIVLPPPNVTGSLHMGHGFQVSIMDALIRYFRMKGCRVLWQAGTDHAGIATQMIVERALVAKGKRRDSLKREELLSHLSEWKRHSEERINAQLKRLGASICFDRNRFTLDEGFQKAIKQVLIQLKREGLLYRGRRLINWDPHLLTAISDLEVLHTEEAGWLYYINYPIVDSDDSVSIATTRPETLFGDTAIAIHLNDARYQGLIGRYARIPLTDRIIPIIADTEVDPTFGTGCVKITPAHDFNDYKIAQKHALPLINIMTVKATLNENVPDCYQGMDCMTARKVVIKDLKAQGMLQKQESRIISVPRGDRSGAIIEPYLTDQWFIHMKPLAEKAIEAIKEGHVRFVPCNWREVCLKWLTNIEDWCISRQLWWGHRIPAWYTKEGECFVGVDEASIRREYGIDQTISLTQDPDVLDTWVSSALWPFVTLGWPEHSEDLDSFYPTDVLVTGFDILFFWVARMLMMSLHFTGKVPFKTVYVTGLIRDHMRQKMSKSKGNVLDPLDVIEGITLETLLTKRKQRLMPSHAQKIEQFTRNQFPKGIDALGADALRMTYYSLASPTRDIQFDINRTIGYRNFCNKLWQVTRFVCNQYSTSQESVPSVFKATDVFNLWILSRLQTVIDKAHRYFEQYRFDHLVQLVYDFVWHDYCDWYVELVKPILKSKEEVQLETRYVLTRVLETVLRLLHPCMPFITETLWNALRNSIAQENSHTFYEFSYPVSKAAYFNTYAEEELAWLQQSVKAIRGLRSELNVPNHQIISIGYDTQHPMTQKRVSHYKSDIARLVKGRFVDTLESTHPMMIRMEHIHWLMDGGTTDHLKSQANRLQKEKIRLDKQLSILEARMLDEAFRQNAPKAIVEKTQTQLEMLRKQVVDIREKLSMS